MTLSSEQSEPSLDLMSLSLGCHCYRQLTARIIALPTGVDYGLGTIGTCLGPPPAGGPPSDKRKKSLLYDNLKNGRENDKNNGIVG